MPQSLAKMWVHIIFSTKGRHPYFAHRPMQKEVHRYIFGICKKCDSPPLVVGGVEDHVHVLCNLSRKLPVMTLVQHIKQGSSGWIKREWPRINNFYWQNGYAAFSVSQSHKMRVAKYIEEQEKHHQNFTFKDELRGFLRKHEVPFDERFIWD